MNKSLLALVFIGLSYLPALTQTPFRVEVKGHYGFLVPHRQGMRNLILGHVPALELNYDVSTSGEKEWHHIYNYPNWGITAYYANLGNPKELGWASGVYPYISFPIIRKEGFDFHYQLGWGFGYISKRWDRESNYKNIVIGSRVNAIIGMRWMARWKITPHISQTTGIAFTHFSNGAYRVPNLGWNIPTVTTGVSALLGESKSITPQDSISKLQRSFNFTLIGAAGVKEIYPPEQKKFGAYSLSFNMFRTLSHKSSLGAGLNLYYNSSLRERLATDTSSVSGPSILQPGVSLNYRMKFTRVSMMLGMGGYLYSKFKSDGIFYHRVGMQYDFSERIVGSLILKSHFFRADFIEFGIGYKLNKH